MKTRQVIMLVDDNQANLNIAKNMLRTSYEVYALPSAERLFKFLETIIPDLILLDIAMPGMNGFDVMRILRADPRYAAIPVIFVTAKSEEMNELEGLELGAADYVTKPFSAAILLKRIENHLLIEKQKAELKRLNTNLIGMVKEQTSQILRLHSSVINIIAELVEFRDVLTGGHISRTQRYVELLIDRMIEDGVYSEEVLSWGNMEYILPSTQLHDLGKIFIGDAILNKPGKLTGDEYEIMKTHAEKGAEAIRRMAEKGENQLFLQYAEVVAGTHHERWDGSGYPKGLRGAEIPLLGRLMAIADVYDALTSARPYKERFSPQESSRIILDGSGTQFDPALVEVFRRVEDGFARIALTT
ncbi:MAG: response regulator [Oscillospiraceae bacterium]|jgi:putative two-component system response regulator|nr:response regulator [Oscillospiraceae bacterium]